jgi:hypothetical protein
MNTIIAITAVLFCPLLLHLLLLLSLRLLLCVVVHCPSERSNNSEALSSNTETKPAIEICSVSAVQLFRRSQKREHSETAACRHAG